MKTKNNNTGVRRWSIVRILLITVGVLMVPLVAMWFTDEVDWSVFDFAIIGSLLVTFGLIFEFAVRKVKGATYRNILATVLIVVLLLIWVELAVGVFGTPFAGE